MGHDGFLQAIHQYEFMPRDLPTDFLRAIRQVLLTEFPSSDVVLRFPGSRDLTVFVDRLSMAFDTCLRSFEVDREHLTTCSVVFELRPMLRRFDRRGHVT